MNPLDATSFSHLHTYSAHMPFPFMHASWQHASPVHMLFLPTYSSHPYTFPIIYGGWGRLAGKGKPRNYSRHNPSASFQVMDRPTTGIDEKDFSPVFKSSRKPFTPLSTNVFDASSPLSNHRAKLTVTVKPTHQIGPYATTVVPKAVSSMEEREANCLEDLFSEIESSVLIDHNAAEPFQSDGLDFQLEPLSPSSIANGQENTSCTELEDLLFSQDPFLPSDLSCNSDVNSNLSHSSIQTFDDLFLKNPFETSFGTTIGLQPLIPNVPLRHPNLQVKVVSRGTSKLAATKRISHEQHSTSKRPKSTLSGSKRYTDPVYKRFITQLCADELADSDPEDEGQVYKPEEEADYEGDDAKATGYTEADHKLDCDVSKTSDIDSEIQSVSAWELVSLFKNDDLFVLDRRPLRSGHYEDRRQRLEYRKQLSEKKKQTMAERKQQQAQKSKIEQTQPIGLSFEQVDLLRKQLQQHLQLLVQNLGLCLEMCGADSIALVSIKLLSVFKMELSLLSLSKLTMAGMEKLDLLLSRLFQVDKLALSCSLAILKEDLSLRPKSSIKSIPFKLLRKSIDLNNQYGLSDSFYNLVALFDPEFNPQLYIHLSIVDSLTDHHLNSSGNNQASSNSGRGEESQCSSKRWDRFLPGEDRLMLAGLYRFGLGNWDMVQARLVPTRTAKQLAVRYKNLTSRRAADNPIKAFCAELMKPLNKVEEDLIYQGVKRFGKNFTLISQYFLPHLPPTILKRLWQEMDEARRSTG